MTVTSKWVALHEVSDYLAKGWREVKIIGGCDDAALMVSPEEPASEPAKVECPNCGEIGEHLTTYTTPDNVTVRDYCCHSKLAIQKIAAMQWDHERKMNAEQPEPAAPSSEMPEAVNFDEMPKQLHLAWLMLDVDGQQNTVNGRAKRSAAVALRDWWRSQQAEQAVAVPAKVRMTERMEPASEGGKVECPNCGEMTERSHSRYEGPGPDKWSCKPAQPEPVAAEMPPLLHKERNMLGVMPEPVAVAVAELRAEADERRPYGSNLTEAADALESWWRWQPAPAKVRMTETKALVSALWECIHDQRMSFKVDAFENKIIAAHKELAAVRAQAAEAGKVKMPKVREALVYLKKTIAAANDGWAGAWAILRSSITQEQIDAALAELDAAEKVTG